MYIFSLIKNLYPNHRDSVAGYTVRIASGI